MNSETTARRDKASSLDQCIENVRFVQATELVRSGKYLEAEAMLSPKGQVPETARELDLLARINAHQERFEEAARYWQSAIKKDPSNPNYKNCLEQLSEIQAGKGLPEGGRSTILRVGVGVCVILLTIGLIYWSHQTAETPVKVTPIENKPTQATPNTTAVSPAATVTETVVENRRLEQAIEQMQQIRKDQILALAGQIAAVQTNQAVLLDCQNAARTQIALLSESIAELKGQQAETKHAIELIRSEMATLTAVRLSTTLAPESAPAHLPNLKDFNPEIFGVTVRAQNDNWLISFNSGLFDRDDHFKIGSEARLESVARALVQTQAKFNIHVIGLAEDEPPTWPWSSARTREELGLLRAKGALVYLRGLKIFPSDKVSAVCGTSAQRPFSTPNLNNRTVLIEVSPD